MTPESANATGVASQIDTHTIRLKVIIFSFLLAGNVAKKRQLRPDYSTGPTGSQIFLGYDTDEFTCGRHEHAEEPKDQQETRSMGARVYRFLAQRPCPHGVF
jgi:hypothetical protein